MRRPTTPGWAEEQTPTPFLYHKLNLKLVDKCRLRGCLGGLLSTNIMVDARRQKCGKVLSDLFAVFPWRNCIVWFSLFISLLMLSLLYNNSLTLECIHKTENYLFNANLSIIGIDLAALAILFALFQDKELLDEAKKAFKEQCGVFLFNAVIQLIAIVLFVMSTIIPFPTILHATFILQIWAILLVFDVIIVLFTSITAILNK
jgi:hypothetical protein